MSERTDWETVERHYRAGILPLREIGTLCCCAPSSILKRAKKCGWTRDLSDKVRQEANARLTRRREVKDAVFAAMPQLPEREIIEGAAEQIVTLVRDHRSHLSRGRNLCATLFDQLEEAAANREEIEAAIEEETATADDPNAMKGAQQAAWVRRGQMLRAVSLPAHASVLKDLATAIRSFIPLERQAFSVDAPEDRGRGGVFDNIPAAEAVRIKERLLDIERRSGVAGATVSSGQGHVTH